MPSFRKRILLGAAASLALISPSSPPPFLRILTARRLRGEEQKQLGAAQPLGAAAAPTSPGLRPSTPPGEERYFGVQIVEHHWGGEILCTWIRAWV